MIRYSAYPDYGDQNFDFLGDLPSHWEARRLRFTASEPLMYGANEAAVSEDRTLPRYIRITDVKSDGTLHEDTFRSLPEEIAAPYLLQDGDILLARSGATVGKSFQYFDDWGRAAYAGYLIRYRTDREIIVARFASYYFQTKCYWSCIKSTLIQSTIENFSAEKYKDLYLPLPEDSEQKQIADFLDWKTGQIDALIAKKQQLIEKLQEQRIAVITQAVTKGLNPDAPMRDSGIPWLGKVPEHWEVMKLHHVVRMRSGEAITSADIEESGKFPVFWGNGIRGFTDQYTHEGDFVLIGRQGAWCGNINYAKGQFWASEHAVVAKPDREFCTVWLGETLRAMDLNQYSESAAQPGLSVESIGRLKLPFPPYDEQIEIARYIEERMQNIDRLAKVTSETIHRLTEYRTALITAATTGKIDVRKVKIPEPAA